MFEKFFYLALVFYENCLFIFYSLNFLKKILNAGDYASYSTKIFLDFFRIKFSFKVLLDA